MEERIRQELPLLRQRWPDLEYRPDGHWIKIPSYPLPLGWNRNVTDVSFQIKVGYPGIPPYGIFVPAGLLFNGIRPSNYAEPASPAPPFGGTWGVLSWAPGDGQWRPSVNPSEGSNLMNWVIGFAQRFREGQ